MSSYVMHEHKDDDETSNAEAEHASHILVEGARIERPCVHFSKPHHM